MLEDTKQVSYDDFIIDSGGIADDIIEMFTNSLAIEVKKVYENDILELQNKKTIRGTNLGLRKLNFESFQFFNSCSNETREKYVLLYKDEKLFYFFHSNTKNIRTAHCHFFNFFFLGCKFSELLIALAYAPFWVSGITNPHLFSFASLLYIHPS